MNNVHTTMTVKAGAQGRGVGPVRRAMTLSLLSLLALAATSSAYAFDNDDRDPPRSAQFQRETIGADRGQQSQRQAEDRQRQADERQRQYEEQRRSQMQQEQNAGSAEFRRSGRLTPDERRDLRRQINEAGADIYQNRRR